MIRIKYHTPGTAPATLVPKTESPQAKPLLTLIQFDAESIFEGRFDTYEELIERFDPDKVNWINVDGLGDVDLLRKFGERFGLHALALEDVLNTTQRPKVEHYTDHFFIVSEMIYHDAQKRLAVEQLSIFLGANYVLTIQEEQEYDIFEQIRARLRAGRGFARKMKADYLAYALLDALVDQFYPTLEIVGDAIEEIEEELLSKPSKESLRRLYESKRLLLQLRRAAWPQREIFNTLIRDDSGLIAPETQIFLRDCYDHTTQIIDILESFRDLAAGLMDVYISSLGLRTNEIMRVLTVISSIFIPLTFIAGVYGMNFNTDHPWNMPELNWKYGYFYCLAAMAVVAAGMVAFFKRKNWL
ncbi:MAG TPA: magnesium/cobalt transporter CorA [Terrimicrobiaceae bacterium]|nr:magnesium/cobalt transporter CorA [Terrimicrobiaceae bacterium]